MAASASAPAGAVATHLVSRRPGPARNPIPAKLRPRREFRTAPYSDDGGPTGGGESRADDAGQHIDREQIRPRRDGRDCGRQRRPSGPRSRYHQRGQRAASQSDRGGRGLGQERAERDPVCPPTTRVRRSKNLSQKSSSTIADSHGPLSKPITAVQPRRREPSFRESPLSDPRKRRPSLRPEA